MSPVIKLASYLVPMATAFVPGEGSRTSDLREKGVEDTQGLVFLSLLMDLRVTLSRRGSGVGSGMCV